MKFKRTNFSEDRQTYTEKRKNYKAFLKLKKKSHKENLLHSLQNNLNNPRQFWETVRAAKPGGRSSNSITLDQWFAHFEGLFQCDNVDGDLNSPIVDPNDDDDILNYSIDASEISCALQALKIQKAPGPDGLIGEFYKNSKNIILPFLLKFFNKLFDQGVFPNDWTNAVIQPLHKKGDLNTPDNYRGISLLNISSKLYSFILNKRLTKWMEINNVIGEEQAGFREGRSTTDHVFTIISCIQKQLLRHRKLYVAFIDFRKAFDTVSRGKLWKILKNNGINGKFLNSLRSMYKVVQARVRGGGDLTDSFLCPRGLKQGEVCSPILFSLFINELTKEINMNGRHGIQLSPELVQILILLFADDVALLSDSVVGLQCQLNILYTVAERLDLLVNLDKSNVIVFRNGGYLSQNERWRFGKSELDSVNVYKYLGIMLTPRLSFQPTLVDLANRATKGVTAIIRVLWSIGEHSPSIFFKLFDSQIQTILTYGAEIWGLVKNQSAIERVHLLAMKRFLCVSQKTPKHIVYGELGRYPLFINTYIKCIKFWLRVVHMENSRYPKKAYNMLMSLENQNYTTWVADVRNTLFCYGFGIVWESQTVGNVKCFAKLFKQRLIDCYKQDWHAALDRHQFYRVYSSFSTSICLQKYVKLIHLINYRKVLTRFRFGMLPLRSRSLNFRQPSRNSNANLNCPFCPDALETELHFLLVCRKYNELRNLLIPRKYWRSPNLFKMSLLLSNENESLIVKVCKFICQAFDKRQKDIV
jgi:hypothetical protein